MLCYTKPYLCSLHPEKEMCVCWLTEPGCESFTEYGEAPGELYFRAKAAVYPIEGLRRSCSPDGFLPDTSGAPDMPLAFYLDNPELPVEQSISTVPVIPGQRVYYRTITKRDGHIQASKTYDFCVPAPGRPFKVLELSDLQCHAGCRETLALAAKEHPDCVMYAGDATTCCWQASQWFPVEDCYLPEAYRGNSFFELTQQDEWPLLSHAPIFICPGNHDMDDYAAVGKCKETASDPEVCTWRLHMQLFRPLYPEQEYGSHGKHWYSANFGDLHVVSLNVQRWTQWPEQEWPGWPVRDSIAAGSPQAIWLENDLREKDTRFCWVIQHWHMMNRGDDVQIPFCAPVYTDGAILYPSDDCETVERPLFEKYHVNVVSFGHSHVYERYRVRGVTYLEAAYTGNTYHPPGRDYRPHPTGFLPECEENRFRSYCIIGSDGQSLSGHSVQTEDSAEFGPAGRVFDRFTI